MDEKVAITEQTPEPQEAAMLTLKMPVEAVQFLYAILDQVTIQGPDNKALASDIQRSLIAAASVVS